MSERASSKVLACNIDRKGRTARALAGVLLIVAAILLCFALQPDAGVRIAVAVMLACFGAFALFEAAIGWCALRALGLKTWI